MRSTSWLDGLVLRITYSARQGCICDKVAEEYPDIGRGMQEGDE
jgi:hypothetical protein